MLVSPHNAPPAREPRGARLTPVVQRTRQQQRWLPVLVLPLAGLVGSACTSSGGSVRAEAPSTPATVAVSPLPASSLDATTTSPVTVTTVPATEAPTTLAPTTTAAPTTTEAPTTTAAPTTTLPPNVEIVGASPVPIEAVGARDGEATRVVQDRLLQLGFWHAGSDGKYGHTTKQAVMAFQKFLGLNATGEVDQTTADYLTYYTERGHGTADTGDLIEVDKAKQLLFVVRGGKTLWVINASTGSEVPYEEENKKEPGKIETGDSVTPIGLWKVTRQREEGWWEGDLGEIYRPKYFRGGVAVHGSNNIPNYPASHGCVRVSVSAMDFIWAFDLMPLKTTVWVHGAIPGAAV
ncbi:MAG: L,D-transpeptidase family protein [Actinobacteria bacterium]|nr:L,D-transpeptidase family protein [Actinomycetota bacterium]